MKSNKIQFIKLTACVGNGVAGFAKTVRNPSFSGGAEALNVRGKMDLVFWHEPRTCWLK